MTKTDKRNLITPPCAKDSGWCIQAIFTDSNNRWQLIYSRETTKLVAFAGLVFNYCPMCGRRLEELL